MIDRSRQSCAIGVAPQLPLSQLSPDWLLRVNISFEPTGVQGPEPCAVRCLYLKPWLCLKQVLLQKKERFVKSYLILF